MRAPGASAPRCAGRRPGRAPAPKAPPRLPAALQRPTRCARPARAACACLGRACGGGALSWSTGLGHTAPRPLAGAAALTPSAAPPAAPRSGAGGARPPLAVRAQRRMPAAPPAAQPHAADAGAAASAAAGGEATAAAPQQPPGAKRTARIRVPVGNKRNALRHATAVAVIAAAHVASADDAQLPPLPAAATATAAPHSPGAAANNIVPAAPRGAGVASGSSFRALVLDSAYRPINVVPWFRAVTMELADKVDVVQYHEGGWAVSAYRRHPLPAVVRVRTFVDAGELAAKVALTRRNLLLRDRHTCQYCGGHRDLTLDHVVPVCRGGMNTWSNLVTACQSCNQRKGHKSLSQLGWRLLTPPHEPSAFELGIVVGVSMSEMDCPPPEWAPWLAPFKERLEKLRTRRAMRDAKAAGEGAAVVSRATA